MQKLQWQQSGNNLRLTNSGPLHITLVNGALIDNKGHLSPMRNVMLRPYIDDYGAVVPIPLQGSLPPGPG